MTEYLYYNDKISLQFMLEESKIRRILFVKQVTPGLQQQSHSTTSLEQSIKTQFDAYFAGKLHEFDLPYELLGSPFHISVWNALCEIPYGSTTSYAAIATAIGRPKAARAVGSANHHNPIPIIVPCHRVVGTNGTLTGYAGGLDLKQMLLNIEQGILS
ncbi:MAG: cysteine methyltransferase [Candidatus Cloacimonetes bacterium HGW-Cloacimonetes-1]|nr:MAG: cysteine methyltransferase [Candidatus Cloacimonetes bacterium HGW-Cloacimonetes-1]